jgi:tetratricopeptide (TPR) repeat protein
VSAEEDESSIGVLFALFYGSVLARDKEASAALVSKLSPLADQLNRSSWMAVGRLLGDANSLLGNLDEARAFYAKAIDICAEVRHRPELALTRLSLAELLLEHYPDERDAAIEHLDFAIGEFREMKMQPSLERALRHRGLLKA